MTHPLLALQELSKYYVNGQNVVAGLNKVSISFERGEFVAITGESGSGKSSLAHILGGILPYEDGELYYDGKPTSHFDSEDWERYRAGSIAFISQNYGILPGATVEENVISALRLTGVDKTQAVEDAKSILEEVELWSLRSRRAAKLSSGQKQRLSIARALAKPCSVLIADEPTGNLDPENSDKVIRLLAKASQDRLVILITHEFSEAEDYVTRHISLQDGRICADAKLRQSAAVERPQERRKAVGDLSAYIAGLQMRSRPAWSVIVLIFIMLTAFSVFAFLGSFIVALDDTSTRIYESDAFLNGEKTRIVAVRADGQAMTQEDYDTILSVNHVRQLDKFGYIQDISYAYVEGTDYVINYPRFNHGTFREAVYIEVPTVEFLSTQQYMKTIPLSESSDDFLTSGTMPRQFNEVVAAGDKTMLGRQFSVYLRNIPLWDMGGCIEVEMTVVGVTDQGSGLYFHDDVARSLTMDYLGAEYTYIPCYDQVPSDAEYINYRDARSKVMYGQLCAPFYAVCEPKAGSAMQDMKDSEIFVSLGEYVNILTDDPSADYDRIYSKTYSTEFGSWNVAGLNKSTVENVLAVTPAVFKNILKESGIDNGDQVSITVTDYAYTQRVINELEKAGYHALSPYVLGSARIDPDLAAQRVQTLAVCIVALLVIVLLQLIVLRAMFAMETESYRTLSDMGLTRKTAQKSVFWQVFVFTLAGQLLGIAGIILCGHLGIPQIAGLTKYLYGYWWAVISMIHLASTMAAAWLIAAALKKRVYPRGAVQRDLVIDDEEAA